MDLNGTKLDFSEFHPLDHPLRACRGYPGGRRTHLRYQWAFKTEPWLRTHTTCLLGWHKPGRAQGRAAVGEPWFIWDACVYCAKPLSQRQPL